MDILQAKLDVIAAGKRLLETGLIARTWGNVSARVDDASFVITPSGKAYENLEPDDIVLVQLSDMSYEGDVKPSSEKGIHAQAFLLRPDVNFVIHTHQHNASIAACMGQPVVSEFWTDILGESVPIAGYGLPGTKKLVKGIVKAIEQNPGANAILMAHHGALCVGKDPEEAFKVADALEKACLGHLKNKLAEVTGEIADTLEGIQALIAARRAKNEPAPALDAYTSFRSGKAFCMAPEGFEGESVDVSLTNGEVFDGLEAPDTLELHRAIYKKNGKVNAIVHSKKPDIVGASKARQKLLPYLDDFAQIAGVNLRVGRFNPNNQLESAAQVAKALKRRSAVLLEDNGALCVGSSLDEARAVETVTEKNAAVSITRDLFGKVKAIGIVDSTLMRVVYVMKYSKKK